MQKLFPSLKCHNKVQIHKPQYIFLKHELESVVLHDTLSNSVYLIYSADIEIVAAQVIEAQWHNQTSFSGWGLINVLLQTYK